jgi:signal peptidase II
MNRSMLANFRSPTALACFLIPAVIGLVADLWTKHLAQVHLAPTDNIVQFLPELLHFRYVRNYGAVFGLGTGQRLLFIGVSVAAIGFLGYLLAASGRQRGYQVMLGLLLAGVLGNLYDRLVHGFVRDMIHIFPGWQWVGTQIEVFPWVFNIADALLCVGVGAMIIHSLFFAPDEPGNAEPDKAEPGAKAQDSSRRTQ